MPNRPAVSLIHPASSRQLRVTMTSFTPELGHSHAALPLKSGRDNASVRTGGRRRRRSLLPGGNGQDTVKDRQGKPTERYANG